MTDDYDDLASLLGAVGPYLHLTTGLSNPIGLDEPDEVVYDEDSPTDYWEDEEE